MSRLIEQMAVLFVSALATLPTYALDGDTLVPTKTGHKAIKDIQLGELVLSKNETTNQVDYQSVSNLYNDQSAQTVYVSIGDNQGNFQTLKTSKTHPFFVQSDDITPSSEGYVYQGDIKNANWTDASSLKAGDKLLSENGTWQTVQSVQINQEPITAYHLTVNNNHTFFVTANSGKYGAWVHNNGKQTNLSSPNPIHSKELREAYENILIGKGTPNLDANGVQKIYKGRENPKWAGATEWLVPDGGKGYHHRILRMPDGRMGYVTNHDYANIRAFPSPWYPDGGKPPAKPVKNTKKK